MSFSRVSLESALQDARITETQKTCILPTAVYGRPQTEELQYDVSAGEHEEVQSGSARSRPYATVVRVSARGCSSDKSWYSRNENEGISKSILRIPLKVKEDGDSCATKMDLETQQSSVWDPERKERDGTGKVGKEGTEGCPEVGSEVKSEESRLRWPRYPLRSNPERRRRYQSNDVRKVIRQSTPRDKSRKRIEIKETDNEETEEDTGHQIECARVDFIYKGHERTHVRPEERVSVLRNQVRFLTRGCESDRRSERREAQLYISRSNIHGKGLFTKREIVAGRIILEFVGEKIRPVIADLREKKYEAKGSQSSYMFSNSGGMVIDSTRKGGMGRFINHSCCANSEANSEDRRIFVRALRLIEEGEEITLDYGHNESSSKQKCNCGAMACCGEITV